MHVTRRSRHARAAHAAPLLTATLFAFVLALTAPRTLAQQTEAPSGRPQGPAAGPIIKLPRGAGAEAESSPRTEAARAAPRKWEYCAIVGFNWKQRGFSLSSPSMPSAVVRFFPNTLEEIDGASEEDALANAFVRLGAEGWELTGIRQSLELREGDGKSTHTFYFKRPVPEE